MKRKKPTMALLRRKVRRQLYDYLDAMLRSDVTAPNGEQIPMLDDLCVRAAMGFGFAVGISCRHPEAPDTEIPTPQPVTPPPVVIHAPGCHDASCGGQCRTDEMATGRLEVVR